MAISASDVRPFGEYRELNLSDTDVTELPEGITVQFALRLAGCAHLRRLPAGLRVGTLDVSRCPELEGLPEGISATFIDLSDCPQITCWPKTGSLSVGRLRARNCVGLTGVPHWLGRISQLDLAGCARIRELPEGLQVSSWVDIAGTELDHLPKSLEGVGLRWRGVTIDERIAFSPQKIAAKEILAEPNAELRRVMMERMGFERFLNEANPEVLDSDVAPGGWRKLFRVSLEGDEPLVCVSVGCPSTERRYLLRVPPTMATCHQAVAWTAGFDDPNDYAPIQET